MSLGLEGARAVVTGGTRGMGAATVRRLVDEGARVVAIARNAAPVPAGVHLVTADLSTADGVEAAAAAALDHLGGLDVLIDNAGQNSPVPAGVLAADDEDWRVNLDTNLLSVVRLDRILVPHLVAQGSGAVVHVSSGAARSPQPNAIPYAAAKAALNAYSTGLATAVGPHGVRVTGVLPGIVENTESYARAAADTGRTVEQIRADLLARLPVPLGRIGTPEEAAEVIVFQASPRASYLTGILVPLDGGLLASR
ncbi:oxidoreductase [Cryptosporangium phraense]|uniref:oxidoreductase n=1 Tax=Cryptosporangium phraense TaxID=2593070 RepID=UPI00197A9121|nr:oxidoreductase [Cryptosporangium phraense]